MSDTRDIWSRWWAIRDARVKETRRLMEAYDRDVYYPAVEALQAECEALGHSASRRYHRNGLGWEFEYCNSCGKRTKTEEL